MKRHRWYKLEGRKAVPCDNFEEAAQHYDQDDRVVAANETALHVVSTCFLGLDHNLFGSEPHLFETMFFEKDHTEGASTAVEYGSTVGAAVRYPTWEDAEAGHQRVLAEVMRREAQALHIANFTQKLVDDE